MSLAITYEEFDQGLMMIHHQLCQAIKTYEEYLVIFGTCPDMSLVDELKANTNKMLMLDRKSRDDAPELMPFKEVFE